MNLSDTIGYEIADYDLLNFPAENLPVMINKKTFAKTTIVKLLLEDFMHGVSIKKLTRGGINIKIRPGTELEAGDIIEVAGIPSDVERAAKKLGYIDRPTNITDIIFLCLGIVVGVYFGSLMIRLGKIPVSLGSSGGVLLAGLFLGWLRSKRPTFGTIPESSVWLMRTLGLSMYVAIIGIVAAPSFGSSLQSLGWEILVFGAISTTVPLLVGIFLGKYVFKFKGPITLGCIAGARTSTPVTPKPITPNNPTLLTHVSYLQITKQFFNLISNI